MSVNYQIIDIVTVPITIDPVKLPNYQVDRRKINMTMKPKSKQNIKPKPNSKPKLVYKKFPSYLYDAKHHSLKIVRKHWKPVPIS